MFRKKRCGNCNEKISDSYNFCPYCRAPLSEDFDDGDFGMLGRNDFVGAAPLGGFGLPPGLGTLFNSLMKNLSKQMSDLENVSQDSAPKKQGPKKRGIGISIYTSGNKPPEIRVTSYGEPAMKTAKKKLKKLDLPLAAAGKFSGLPKAEPKTSIRRFSDKVVYEIDVPGVKSIDDVSISQLESSIEVKALAKDKVYQKIIPINLPIRGYNFSKKKLTLELDSQENQ